MAQWVMNLPAMQEKHEFEPWVRRIPWRKKWLPTPMFLPEKSQEQGSLADYSPRVAQSQTQLTKHPRTGKLKGGSVLSFPPHPLLPDHNQSLLQETAKLT